MKKVLLEILLLVWKVLRLYLWKYLRPYLGKLVFLGFVGIAVMTVLVLLVVSAC